MTDTEIQNQINQATQDAIALDYSKWSAQRIQSKLSNDHELWQQERDRTLARQQSDNAETRRRYLAKLDGEKQAREVETNAAIDLELAPTKKRLQNQWLVDNPTFTPADFETKAWIHLRQNLIEQRSADVMNAEIQAQAATGRYSL